MQIKIANDIVGPGQPVYLIAEAGVNHNGRLALALRLIDAAADAGAQAVKFQTFRANQLVTASADMAAYQEKNLGTSESQLSMLKKLELDERFYPTLLRRCAKRKITFLSTPHGGNESLRLLARLNVPAIKIGSGDLTNIPLLEASARLGKPMIVSTGMGTLAEIRQAIRAVHGQKNRQLVLLHCTSNYPTPPDQVNLAAMQHMARVFKLPIGYSDHSLDLEIPLFAAAAGACVIEKHFTLDRRLPGPDHVASIEPRSLKQLVSRLRALRVIQGSGHKGPNPSEKIIMPLVRKSLVTLRPIKAGALFTRRNLGIKRPGTGLPPALYHRVLGARATRDLPFDIVLHGKDYE